MDSDTLKLNEKANGPANDLIDDAIEAFERLREKRYSLRGTLYEIDDVVRQLAAYWKVLTSLTMKLGLRQETKKFSHALVFFPKRLMEREPDKEKINEAMRLFGRPKATRRVSVGNQTAIAFQSERDAVAFRLGYSGTFTVKSISLADEFSEEAED